MELSFELNDTKKCKIGKFIVKNLSISDVIGNPETKENDIFYDDIELYLDGNKYSNTFRTEERNVITTDDIFEQCINAYIRNDIKEYKYFSDEWKVFDKTNELKEYQGDILTKLPVLYMDKFIVYDLDLATSESKYYCNSDGPYFIVLDNEGYVKTDMEYFYDNSINNDIYYICKGIKKCLYQSANIKKILDMYGNKENFLKEHKKNNSVNIHNMLEKKQKEIDNNQTVLMAVYDNDKMFEYAERLFTLYRYDFIDYVVHDLRMHGLEEDGIIYNFKFYNKENTLRIIMDAWYDFLTRFSYQ